MATIGREQILTKIKSLPSMPNLVARLYEKINDRNCGSVDLEEIIRTDPSLTTNLLRMANSAFFGLPRKVDNIQFAVTLLGRERVFEAATGSSFLRIIPHRLPGYELDSRTYWIHCVAVAILTEQLTKEIGVRTPQLAFVAGLLHDVGKLAISSFLADEADKIKERLANRSFTFLATEREVLGTDHAELGADLVDRWNLPFLFATAARWHHTPSEAPPQVNRTLIDLIHCADGLAHSCGYGEKVAELQHIIEPEATKRLNMKVQDMQRAVTIATPAIEQMGGLIEQ